MKRNMEQVPGPDHGRKKLAPLPPVTRSRPSGLLLDVHAVEDVTAEGIDLEVLHFLAHRLEHHRMCDGGPGRLLLEDDLSLLVELRPLVFVADENGSASCRERGGQYVVVSGGAVSLKKKK